MNSVTFIEGYNGPDGVETLALCAARPNWLEAMKLEASLPTDVTRGLSARESRRAFALTSRYTFEHLFDAKDAADSTDLRLWLNRLKNETVAVPLWTDQVELRLGCNAGATTLQKTSPNPARYGGEWLLLDPEGFVFEIVNVNDVGDTTVTLASPGTQFPWPAGATLFPLMFGRLTERPEFDSITDELLSGRLKFKEDSSYARRLTARFLPPNLAGSHLPGYEIYKLWTAQPQHTRLLDRTEADILYKRFGPAARQEQSYAFPNWNRRALELEFLCDRDGIATIEWFFSDRQGSTLPFFIPTFRGDLRLAADVASGAATFQIEDSRYEQPSYDAHPGSAFLAFVDRNGVYPQRIDEVDGTTIRPQIAVSEAHPRLGTKVSFLMLVRFAESKLTWSYDADGTATCRVKFIEVADEYVTPNTAVPTPRLLYHFYETLPNGSQNNWYYTSFEAPVTYGGQTYLPAPFFMEEREANLDLDENFQVTSWGGDFTGNPMNRFLPFIINSAMILRVDRLAVGASIARFIAIGKMTELDTNGTDWVGTFRDLFGSILDQQFPRKLLQTSDNWTQYSLPTQISSNSFKDIGTFTSVAYGGDVQTVRITLGPTRADDWFSGSWLQTGSGVNQEVRFILKSTAITGGQELTIERPLVHAIVGQAVSLFAGYDGSREQCDTRFNNNINFGGYPFMPPSNPAFTADEIAAPSAGKGK